jgi:hypothetical protein
LCFLKPGFRISAVISLPASASQSGVVREGAGPG